jgi:hypothetical protein
MKKTNCTPAAMPKGISPVESKTPSAPLPPHSTIRKVQIPTLAPEFSRLYLASLLGRQRT